MSKKIYFVLMALLMLLAVSCVSAAEDVDNSTAAVDEQVEVLTTIDDVSLESGDDADVLSDDKANPNLNINPNADVYGQVSFRATTEKDATGTVNVKFARDGERVVADVDLTLNNGVVSWGGAGNFLPKGNYLVTAKYSGDDKYASATVSTDRFNVARNHVNFNFTDLSVNEKGNIVANGVIDNERATGKYNIQFINRDTGKSIIVYGKDVKAKGIVAYEDAPLLGGGEYEVSLWYIGTDEYFPTLPQYKYINVSEIVVNKTINLGIGDEIDSGASLNPADAGDLIFVSSNESVVKVDAKTGLLTGVSFGEAIVNVSCAGNDKYGPAITKSITVSVRNTANITVNPTELDLHVGESSVINATLTPADAGVLNYTSSNSSVVTVDKNGKVVAVSAGEANITVSFAGNDTFAAVNKTVTVNVTKIDTSITVGADSIDMYIGDYANINATLSPDDAGEMDFTSSDVSVVTVNGIGELYAVGTGTANITVSFYGNDKYAEAENKTVTVTVNKIPTAISGKDYTQYVVDYKAGERGKDFTVQLKDANGNVLANKTVTITYSDKVLTRTTDAKGYASVQINFDHKLSTQFTVSFEGDDKYEPTVSKYTISTNLKPVTITAPAKTFKATAKTKKYTVTLKTIKGASSNGKIYLSAGKKVTMKINGKTYTAKTNSKGQATFSLKITKKSKFTATIKFAGDKTYKAASKSVKITIK